MSNLKTLTMNKIISTLSMVLLLFSCGPKEVTQEIEGKYLFKYPSGHIEILDVSYDHNYKQNFFLSESDYKRNISFVSNNGKWNSNGMKVGFNHWLSICYLGSVVNRIISQPEYYTILTTTWNPPSSKQTGQISIYEENDYVLNKIE